MSTTAVTRCNLRVRIHMRIYLITLEGIGAESLQQSQEQSHDQEVSICGTSDRTHNG